MNHENYSLAGRSSYLARTDIQPEGNNTDLQEIDDFLSSFRRIVGIPPQYDDIDVILISPPRGESKYFVVDETDLRTILQCLRDAINETLILNEPSQIAVEEGLGAAFVACNLQWVPRVHSRLPIDTFGIDNLNLDYMIGILQKFFESKIRNANRLPNRNPK